MKVDPADSAGLDAKFHPHQWRLLPSLALWLVCSSLMADMPGDQLRGNTPREGIDDGTGESKTTQKREAFSGGADEDSIELFNGKDLTGWEANLHPESFTVQDGLLKAHGRNGMSHIFHVDDSGRDVAWKDFELRAIVRSEPGSNSGIFFHTGRELRGGKYLNKGYEVQLNSSKKEKQKTGSLYAIVQVSESPVDETEWFELGLRVEGKRIQVFIGGEKMVDYTEPDTPRRQRNRAKRLIDPSGGALAIQAHDPDSVFYFKSIRIRELK